MSLVDDGAVKLAPDDRPAGSLTTPQFGISEMKDAFRTLRGFLHGFEPDEEAYFAYSATIRIFGDIPDLDAISSCLDLHPTNTHRKGDKPGPRSPGFAHDMWSYRSSLDEAEPLEKHIDSLWSQLKPHKEDLLKLKRHLTVDVFLGYRSNIDHAGIEIPHTSLEMFIELEIPFGMSIIIT